MIYREDVPQIGTLVPSIPQHRGRYALKINGGEIGPDMTSGLRVALLLGDTWIPGTIEHAGGLYVLQSGEIEGGYVFIADGAGCCGLCCGMKVRIL